jgi:glycosyltransferase involved in cell wall biosynthesis
MSVSIIVPMYNERENVQPMYQQLKALVKKIPDPVEIIFVDDGSRDGTAAELDALAQQDALVKIVRFRRNYGQTAAMQAGIQHASHAILVTLDGDMQNEPDDIPMMIAKLGEGYDLIHGWRKQRQDTWLNRKLPSKIANKIISWTTGFPIHDLGCTLKVIRREIAQELELYGEMHRFIPILAHARGARCAEVVVRHHPRRFGTTKYGISRTVRVVLDLITVKYMLDYFASPMKLFGRFGLACLAIGMLAAVTTMGMKYVNGVDMTGNPLLLLTVLSSMLGVQFLSLGLLGEVNARIYYSAQTKQNYAVRELVNFMPESEILPLEPRQQRAA